MAFDQNDYNDMKSQFKANPTVSPKSGGGLLESKSVLTSTPKAFPEAPKNTGLGSIYKTGANSFGDAASLHNSQKAPSLNNSAQSGFAPKVPAQNSFGDAASLQNKSTGILAGSNPEAYQKMQDRSSAGGRPFTDHSANLSNQMKRASGATAGKSFLDGDTGPVETISQPDLYANERPLMRRDNTVDGTYIGDPRR